MGGKGAKGKGKERMSRHTEEKERCVSERAEEGRGIKSYHMGTMTIRPFVRISERLIKDDLTVIGIRLIHHNWRIGIVKETMVVIYSCVGASNHLHDFVE